MKKSVKILAVVLSVLMIVSTLPLSVFAGVLTPVIPVYCVEHIYSSLTDTVCDKCGEEREVLESPMIKFHTYDNECDVDCNVCGETRTAPHIEGTPATCTEKATCALCGEQYGEEPDHTYDNNCDDICNVCGEPRQVSGHVYTDDCDATCNSCGAERTPDHNYNSDWTTDGENHWHQCADCGEVKDKASHTGGTATCKNKAVCEVCNVAYGEKDSSNHTGETKLDGAYDETCGSTGFTGNTVCLGCGEVLIPGTTIPANGNHSYTDNCDAKCDVCGNDRIPPHSYKEEWTTDGDSHWHECSGCGEKKDVASHTGGTATCKDKAVCEVCNEAYGSVDASNHTGETYVVGYEAPTCGKDGFEGDTYCKGCDVLLEKGEKIDATGDHVDENGEWESDETQHFHTCGCGATFDIVEHSYDSVCDADCNECGKDRVPPHNVIDTWVTDGESHWHECSGCDLVTDKTAHTGGTATCTEQAKCSVCNTLYGEILDHVFTDMFDSDCNNGCGFIRNNQSPMICFHDYDDENDLDCNRCGAVKKFTEDKKLVFYGASLVLESAVTIKYKVNKQYLEDNGYSDPFVTFKYHGKNFGVVEASELDKDGNYVFLFRGITPDRFLDVIDAVVYAKNAEGEIVQSASVQYQVAAYCYNKLNNSDTTEELKHLLADLLYYGDKAQLYTGYNTHALVSDKVMTAAQKELYGTKSAPELDQDIITPGANDGELTWKGVGFFLNDGVTAKIRFSVANISGVSIVINVSGKTPYDWTFTEKDFVKEGDDYVLYFNGMLAHEMRESFLVCALRGYDQISSDLSYSVDSYAKQNQNVTANGLGDLVKALINYGDSVCNYFYGGEN